MHGCMDGWMEMDAQMNAWMDGDGCIDECMVGWRWMNGWMDGWMDG